MVAGDMIQTPLDICDGVIHLPDAPGLGVEADEEKLAFYRVAI